MRKYNQKPHRKIYNKQQYIKNKKAGYFHNYQQQVHVKKQKAKAMRIYSKHPDSRLKHEARWQISYRLTSGVIKKPNQCSRCPNTTNIQAHHPDYSKPLEVDWVCYCCHQLIHAKAKSE